MVPWLAILLLLALKSNRGGQTWWIWLPLGCVMAVVGLALPGLPFLPSNVAGIFLEFIGALAFGIAGMWLLAPLLVRKHRFVTFLCLLAALTGFSLFSFVIRQDWGDAATPEPWVGLVPLALSVLAITAATTLAGLACRGRYRAFRLYLWLLVILLAIWTVVIGPFFIVAVITSGDRIPWMVLVSSVLVMTAVSFGTLLPFLILSSSNSLFRQRLMSLLHLAGDVPPPLNTPAPVAKSESEVQAV
jgi:hypothetical protein